MEQTITIIEVANNLQYGIAPLLVVAAGLKLVGGIFKGVKANQVKKDAEGAANAARDASRLATAELAARESRSFVPGFSDNQNIPGYDNDFASRANRLNLGISEGPGGGGMFTTTDPLFSGLPGYQHTLNPSRSAAGGLQGLNPLKNPMGFYGDDDRGPGAPRNEIQYDEGGNLKFNADAYHGTRQPKTKSGLPKPVNFKNALPMQEFNYYTQSLPKDGEGRSIAPDPNTDAGNKFYRSLPRGVAEMIQDPRYAQMYQGSNIVNPYANVVDLSRILENVSGMAKDRTDLLTDRTGMFEGIAGLGSDLSGQEDLSKRFGDLTTGMQDLSGGISNLRSGAEDYSGLATDTSILASNPYAQLQVSTQAADLQAQQTDQALANTLSTIRATGSSAGGATAIAQAALQSKLGISATIEQQEARNTQLRAEGQQQIETIKMGESQRLQNLALSERLRLEGLREREGLRLDTTRLEEGRSLRDLGLEEGKALRGIELDEGRALRDLRVGEGQRMQTLEIEDSLRRQQLGLDESLRLQGSRYDEAGRLQQTQMGEALRLQQSRLAEQQRLQEADAMAREYQFRVAETREQNRLNRLQNMATQAVQSRSDLEAAELAAKAQRDGAVAGAITGAAEAGLSYYAATKGGEKKLTS
jgi:hypothetical protein